MPCCQCLRPGWISLATSRRSPVAVLGERSGSSRPQSRPAARAIRIGSVVLRIRTSLRVGYSYLESVVGTKIDPIHGLPPSTPDILGENELAVAQAIGASKVARLVHARIIIVRIEWTEAAGEHDSTAAGGVIIELPKLETQAAGSAVIVIRNIAA